MRNFLSSWWTLSLFRARCSSISDNQCLSDGISEPPVLCWDVCPAYWRSICIYVNPSEPSGCAWRVWLVTYRVSRTRLGLTSIPLLSPSQELASVCAQFLLMRASTDKLNLRLVHHPASLGNNNSLRMSTVMPFQHFVLTDSGWRAFSFSLQSSFSVCVKWNRQKKVILKVP